MSLKQVRQTRSPKPRGWGIAQDECSLGSGNRPWRWQVLRNRTWGDTWGDWTAAPGLTSQPPDQRGWKAEIPQTLQAVWVQGASQGPREEDGDLEQFTVSYQKKKKKNHMQSDLNHAQRARLYTRACPWYPLSPPAAVWKAREASSS